MTDCSRQLVYEQRGSTPGDLLTIVAIHPQKKGGTVKSWAFAAEKPSSWTIVGVNREIAYIGISRPIYIPV